SPRSAADLISAASAAAHSFHVKCPASNNLMARANACACHGSANTGPSSSRGGGGSAARRSASWRGLDALKVVVPHVQVHEVAGGCPLSPQFARREADRIQMLRVLAGELSVGVGKHEHAVIANNDARFPPRVARQACVTRRMHVASPHALPHLELRE